MRKTPVFVFWMPTVTGDIFDFGDKVRAVRKGNGYLARGASCESYYAHRRYSFVRLQHCLQDLLPGRKSVVEYMGDSGLSRTSL